MTPCSNNLRRMRTVLLCWLQDWETNAHVCAASAAMTTGRRDIAFEELDAAANNKAPAPINMVALVARATWMSADRGALYQVCVCSGVATDALPLCVLRRSSRNARRSPIVAPEPFAATISRCCAGRRVRAKARAPRRSIECFR